jgi:hypothetical protein
MEVKLGLINGVECKFVKTDASLIESVAKRTGMSIDMVKTIMRYNVFTINQFSQLSGKAISTITNMTRPIYRAGQLVTELDFCFPFPDRDNEGPKFVIRNEKSERYLKV